MTAACGTPRGHPSSWLRHLRLPRPMASTLPRSPFLNSQALEHRRKEEERKAEKERKEAQRVKKALREAGYQHYPWSRSRTAPTGTNVETWEQRRHRPSGARKKRKKVGRGVFLALPPSLASLALGNQDIVVRGPCT